MNFNINNIIEKKKKLINKLIKKYPNIENVQKEYENLLKKYINKNQELLNKEMQNLLNNNKIQKKDFFAYIDNKNYIIELNNLMKKHKITLNDTKKLSNLIYSEEIPIFLDFDEIMVDLISVWLKDYNDLVNKWLNEEAKFWKIINQTEQGKKLELVNNFITFFSNKPRKYYKAQGYNIYGNDNSYLYVYNKEELSGNSDNNYQELEIDTGIEKLREIFDITKKVPKVFVEKLWKAYKTGKKFRLTKQDIDHFHIFNELPLGLNFLEKGNIYLDENFENPIVKPKPDALKLYKQLDKLGLLEKTYILTSSFPGTEYSKYMYVKKIFPKLADKIITTKQKGIVAKGGIMIDDGPHNVQASVIKSDYTYGLILNYPHNLDLATGKRIKRINSLEEVIDYLPLLHLAIYDRLLNTELTQKNLLKIENNNINEILEIK